MQLCRAEQAVIYRQQDGKYRFAAGHSTVPAYLEIEKQTVILPGKGTVVGRSALAGRVRADRRCVERSALREEAERQNRWRALDDQRAADPRDPRSVSDSTMGLR